MRLSLHFLVVLGTILPLLAGCQQEKDPASLTNFANLTGPNEFGAYWYQQKAELSTYDLGIESQGEVRQGEAILIFAVEDLSKSRQVILDVPDMAGDDRVRVMQLNKFWRFNTGMSDLSLMGSVYTPLDLVNHPYTFKQTSSLQEWGGQSFYQINRDRDRYEVHQYAYYETGEDRVYPAKPDLLEDEIFTRIRINPASVPSGELEIVPGDFSLRLAREPVKPKRARIQFLSSEATTQCLVEYLHLDRTVRINFETAFPHRILSWTEEQGQRIMVEGKLRKTIQDDFRNKFSGEFLSLRDSLMLAY